MFGLSGKVLEWFRLYLKDPSQIVSVQGALCDVLSLVCGFPKGVTSWPSYFHMYT